MYSIISYIIEDKINNKLFSVMITISY